MPAQHGNEPARPHNQHARTVRFKPGQPQNHELWRLGVISILTAAVMHGLSYVLTKKFGSEISIITFNTLPIGIAGLALVTSGIILEHPNPMAFTTASVMALLYLGVVASVAGFMVYFYLLKQLQPVVLSFVFVIFPAISVVIGAWYDHTPLGDNFVLFMILLLLGFAITKFPLEQLLSRPKQEIADL